MNPDPSTDGCTSFYGSFDGSMTRMMVVVLLLLLLLLMMMIAHFLVCKSRLLLFLTFKVVVAVICFA